MISTKSLRDADLPDDQDAARHGVRVLLVGGRRLSRAGLRLLIERQPGFLIVGEASTARESIALVREAAPDIVVLDAEGGADAVAEDIRQIQIASASTRVLVIADHCSLEAGQQIVLAGARGLILKDKSPEHLLRAIGKVHEGELWVDRATTALLISGVAGARKREAADPERAKIESLTAREREVIALLAKGMTNKDIAGTMKISDHTVRHHLTSIFDKLGARDRLGLVVYAYRQKIVLQQG